MFFITSDLGAAQTWQDMHASAAGLPPGMEVREIKQHPHQDTYAYLVPHEGDVVEINEPWAQAIINGTSYDGFSPDPPDAQVETLPEEWYLGSTAPVSSLTDKDEFFRSSPGVTSINGLTGDIVLDDLGGTGGKNAWNADVLLETTGTKLDDLLDQIDNEGVVGEYQVQPGQFVHFPTWGEYEVTFVLTEMPADDRGNWKSVDGIGDDLNVSTSIGNLKDSYSEGTPIEVILQDLLTTVTPPTYNSPIFRLYGPDENGSMKTGTTTVEAGTEITGNLRAEWTRRDAGGIDLSEGSSAFTIDGTDVLNSNPSATTVANSLFTVLNPPDTFTGPVADGPTSATAEKSITGTPPMIVSQGVQDFHAEFHYKQGAAKENSIGEIDESGRISSGRKRPRKRYRGQRKLFVALTKDPNGFILDGSRYLDPDVIAGLTAQQVRTLLVSNQPQYPAGSWMPPPNSRDLTLPPQTKSLILAYPKTEPRATISTAVGPATGFPYREVDVDGADGNRPTKYRVHHITIEIPSDSPIEYSYSF